MTHVTQTADSRLQLPGLRAFTFIQTCTVLVALLTGSATASVDYDEGYWSGLSEGSGGYAPADLTGMSAEYQGGYLAGYAHGVASSTSEPSTSPDDYGTGYWSGLSEGSCGCPPSDLTGMSAEYQAGYVAGYADGAAASTPEPSTADNDMGYWAGLSDGSGGYPPADLTGMSAEYQTGYVAGYADGAAASTPEAGTV